ncbi:hypothetical protein [Pseudohongiella spirulinae]|uniref:Uncharacterized protein n=1 Tax=Pseudohongiella spirulinae TaxID=1249552 RepID=A0A0S2KED0_9GAMM|nr:hypothetical protein [Pseudohongiella spirulinae]ALO46585.1 hypothetical protein PS2015_1941 [Pseudohongiella spirulinae]
MSGERESWHLSKSVPITLIVALLIQAAAVVWHGSQWTAAIHQNRTDIDKLAAEHDQMNNASSVQAIQLARIEENTRNLAERIADLVRQLERRQPQP